MSKRKHSCNEHQYCTPGIGGVYGFGCKGGFGGYNFTTLIVLILIILQFGRKRFLSGDEDYENDGYHDIYGIDNAILFIIALFFLVCGCKGGYGVGTVGYRPMYCC